MLTGARLYVPNANWLTLALRADSILRGDLKPYGRIVGECAWTGRTDNVFQPSAEAATG